MSVDLRQVALYVVAAIVVAAAVAVTVTKLGKTPPHTTGSATTAAHHSGSATGAAGANGGRTATSSSSAGRQSSNGGRSASSGRRGGSSSRGHGTTNQPATLQPSTYTTTAAVYEAPPGTYTLGLSASGPCWISASETATGQVVWTGTLQPGQSRQIAATGGLFVRLGAAFDVALVVNGEPVTLPTGHVSPFNVTFTAT